MEVWISGGVGERRSGGVEERRSGGVEEHLLGEGLAAAVPDPLHAVRPHLHNTRLKQVLNKNLNLNKSNTNF